MAIECHLLQPHLFTGFQKERQIPGPVSPASCPTIFPPGSRISVCARIFQVQGKDGLCHRFQLWIPSSQAQVLTPTVFKTSQSLNTRYFN